MKKIYKFSALLALLLWIPFSGFAWGMLGHRIIGQIAESYLSKDAKKEIYKILGNESLAMSANWADFVKSDSTYDWLTTWHYINIPSGKNEQQVNAILAADTSAAYARINFLVVKLKNKNLDIDKKKMYLRILVHLVGDIHQPLHVGRPEDLGGNRVKVIFMSNPTNLHSLWDSQLINFQQLSFSEYAKAINFTTKSERRGLYKQPVSYWFWQSYQHAEKIYADIKEPDQKLDYKYNYKYLGILNEQLLLGGVHLAGLLNEIFD